MSRTPSESRYVDGREELHMLPTWERLYHPRGIQTQDDVWKVMTIRSKISSGLTCSTEGTLQLEPPLVMYEQETGLKYSQNLAQF